MGDPAAEPLHGDITDAGIDGTLLNDWSALAAIETLEMLDLTDNEITDLSPGRYAAFRHAGVGTRQPRRHIPIGKQNLYKKLEEAAGSCLEASAETGLVRLNWNWTALAAKLAVFVNISQFSKEGGLYEDAFPVYLREIRLNRLLSRLTNGKLELSDRFPVC